MTAPFTETFQRWVERGVLEGVWAVLIEECWELDGVNWEWQSADCSMGKARFRDVGLICCGTSTI